MRGRRLAPLVVAAVVAGAWAGPAGAGGGWWSWIDLDAPYVGVGERVRVTSQVMFDSVEAAERARRSDEYEVYLLRGVDQGMVRRAMSTGNPGDWWTPPPRMWHVGDVRVERSESNLADAVSRATIAAVPPGRYSLMFCTARCAEPLASVVPLDVRVSPDADLAARVRRLTARKWELKHSAALARRRAARARREVGDVTDSLEERDRADAAIEDLDERVSELTAAVADDGSGGGGGGLAAALGAGLVLGALAAAGLQRARRLRSRAAPSREPAAVRR